MSSTHKLHLKIATPDRVVYDQIIDHVSIPTTSGEITVYKDHIPLISVIKPGELRIVIENNTYAWFVDGGVMSLAEDNVLTILLEGAESTEEMDITFIRGAYERAQELKNKKDSEEDFDYAKAEAILQRELARLRVAEKYHR